MTHYNEQPVFCFTSDLDWAPEWAIESLLDRFEEVGFPLTPFVTHKSPLIQSRFSSEALKSEVGLHPNFLPGSTHGNSPEEVIEHVFSLWPEASTFRSHSFVDSSLISDLFTERGMRYDSNLCLFLQPDCRPLCHCSGMWRFPVFWEDDVHYKQGLSFEWNTLKGHIETPGLKVFNVHPLLYALNVPDEQFYNSHKHSGDVVEPSDCREHEYGGSGVRTLLDELLNYLVRKNIKPVSLRELYLMAEESLD
ncbi:MAG: hypothetical protein DRP45_03425 [Candidatus Zixiibacteriota bacterium]|nr:MAG: hypothetical protein DRP45_03425 [candidate division Zixibacteria bacterium]